MNVQVTTLPRATNQSKLATADCDIHPQRSNDKQLHPYLEKRWIEHMQMFGARPRQAYQAGPAYPKGQPNASRRDAWPPEGGRPGSSLRFMREQLLDQNNCVLGVLNPTGDNGQAYQNREFGAAVCHAMNEWVLNEWLIPEPRLKGSIVVPFEDPEAALAELELYAGDPRFVQVLMLNRTAEPAGQKRYWKLYEAAAAANLPIGVHAFGFGGHPSSGSGWPSYYIDEIHTVIGAGATSGGAMDASNLLKPALASGSLRCVGSTTYKEFRNYFEKDRALVRRFQKIDVNEPSIEDTVKILRGLKLNYEKHHKVEYTEEALRAAVELSAKYIHDRKLPDKAIDVIDEVGASRMLVAENLRRKIVTLRDVEEIVAKIARIPPKSVSADDKETLRNLERDLKAMVYGQDKAIEALAAAIKLARAGLREPEKPIGNYLFSGPTGVGKTEVARQLASIMGIELIRFDMSEYMERHSISRLIGAPPGYVGFDQGGMLTDAIDQHPHAVLLLDEIEKAHPDLFNILLQVMDHGKLTDHNGKVVDFRNIVLIMTTNAGASDLAKEAIGFGRESREGEDGDAIKRLFTPEFRNRLDATIPFAALTPEIVGRVVEKFVMQLEAQLADRNVTIELSSAAKEWLAERGYDRLYGARPLGRVIQEYIKKPLAEELLFGKLVKGGSVKVTLKDGKLEFETLEAAPPALPGPTGEGSAEQEEPETVG